MKEETEHLTDLKGALYTRVCVLLTSVCPAGVLYNQFLSQADFEVLRDRAQVGFCFLTK